MDRREFLSWLMKSPLGLQNSWRELPSAPTVDIPRHIGEFKTAAGTVASLSVSNRLDANREPRNAATRRASTKSAFTRGGCLGQK
jgi:hypothetical protein